DCDAPLPRRVPAPTPYGGGFLEAEGGRSLGGRGRAEHEGFVRQKRAKSYIHSIEADGSFLTQESQIRESAVAHFQTLFTSDRGSLVAPTVFAVTTVTHLTRFGSDHSPLLIRCRFSSTRRRSSFRFQNRWVRHHSFHDTVRDSWLQPTGLFGIRNLEAKLGRLRRRLRQWNWDVFGNLHQRLAAAQSAHATAERAYDLDPTPGNRTAMHRCHAEYQL
ncbi:3-dehydroquinate dehydratase, partial [Striga asiatica]